MNTSPASLSISSEPPTLGHSIYGHGPEKVLVFHDWMGDAANYDPILSYLEAGTYTYVFADLRGYGKSQHLRGTYTVDEVTADAFRLVDQLGWDQFHLVGHSMTGMVAQRMALFDWTAKARRIKRVVAITPVSADGYPADEATKQFLWAVIGNHEMSQTAFSMLTGQRLLQAWGRVKTERNFKTSNPEAIKGYYGMWLETDFSAEVRAATVGTPMLVIGGRQDLPGFQEDRLHKTFGAWYPNAEFAFITDAGHYPMQETPVYLASLVEQFLGAH